MRRALSVSAVAAVLIVAGASVPRAASASTPATRLTIVTLPKLAGIRFVLDGRLFVTGTSGFVRIPTTRGTHLLQVLDPSVRRPDTRATFKRWGDGRFTATRRITVTGSTVLYAGYRQSVRVDFGFTDPDGNPVIGRVTRVILSNSLGGQFSFAPTRPQWLPAVTVTRRFTGLGETRVRYSIRRVSLGGANVVNDAQQRFYPAETRHVTAPLLLYSARVNVRDFLLGTSSGKKLDLFYPNGTRASYPLTGKVLRLSLLPRGTYRIEVHGSGYVPAVSLALSRNQTLRVRVISYLDMLLFLGMMLAAVSFLALVARPYLRLRIRSLGSGRRPTPDDLEPAKPLSGERKALLSNYVLFGPVSARSVRSVRQLPVFRTEPVTEAADGLPRRHRKHAVGAITSRLRSFQDARKREPREALGGERIELVQVYMGETVAPAPEAVSFRAQPAEAAASDEKERRSRRPLIAQQASKVLIAARGHQLAARWIGSTPAVDRGGLVEPTAEVAPLEDERTVFRPDWSRSGVATSGAEGSDAATEEVDSTPKRVRSTAEEKAPTRAKAKAETTAKQKADRTAAAKPPVKKKAPVKRKASVEKQAEPVASPEPEADGEELAGLRPDFAVAVDALREDLEKLKATAPAKPKRTTASAKEKASAKSPATRSARQPKKAELVAPVEALQTDLRGVDAAKSGKSGRKSSAKTRQ